MVSLMVWRLGVFFFFSCGVVMPSHTVCLMMHACGLTGVSSWGGAVAASRRGGRPIPGCTQAEEAKAIIPSLREENKIANHELNQLLMELTTFAK